MAQGRLFCSKIATRPIVKRMTPQSSLPQTPKRRIFARAERYILVVLLVDNIDLRG